MYFLTSLAPICHQCSDLRIYHIHSWKLSIPESYFLRNHLGILHTYAHTSLFDWMVISPTLCVDTCLNLNRRFVSRSTMRSSLPLKIFYKDRVWLQIGLQLSATNWTYVIILKWTPVFNHVQCTCPLTEGN